MQVSQPPAFVALIASVRLFRLDGTIKKERLVVLLLHTLRVTFETMSCTPHHRCHMSRVTRHTSHVTRHTSHVTHHTSHVTRHTSHVTRHTSQLTPLMSHVPQGRPALVLLLSDVISIKWPNAAMQEKSRRELARHMSAAAAAAAAAADTTPRNGFSRQFSSGSVGGGSYSSPLSPGFNSPTSFPGNTPMLS